MPQTPTQTPLFLKTKSSEIKINSALEKIRACDSFLRHTLYPNSPLYEWVWTQTDSDHINKHLKQRARNFKRCLKDTVPKDKIAQFKSELESAFINFSLNDESKMRELLAKYPPLTQFYINYIDKALIEIAIKYEDHLWCINPNSFTLSI